MLTRHLIHNLVLVTGNSSMIPYVPVGVPKKLDVLVQYFPLMLQQIHLSESEDFYFNPEFKTKLLASMFE